MLYIIKPTDLYTLKRDEIQGRKPALDDIHLASRGDDMPSLSAWIKKEATFVYPKLLLFFVNNCNFDKRFIQRVFAPPIFNGYEPFYKGGAFDLKFTNHAQTSIPPSHIGEAAQM